MFAKVMSHLCSSLLCIMTLAATTLVLGSWAAAQDDSMGLPPRTSQPPASVQQQPEQPPGSDRQTGAPAISPIQSTSKDEGRFVFKKQVQEVVLHATVVD